MDTAERRIGRTESGRNGGILELLFRPKAATGETSTSILERLIKDTFWTTETEAGISVTVDNSMQLSTVYSCVNVLSQSIAQLPLHFFRQDGRNRERVTDDTLSFLIEVQPNQWMSPYEMKMLLMQHILMRGNSLWFKTRGTDGQVRELIPIRPDRVKAIQQDELYRIYYHIVRPGKNPNREVDIIPAENIVHFKGLSLDGIRGVSPIEYLRETIGLAKAAEKHGGKIFSQGAKLGGILLYPGRLSGEAKDRLEADFEAKYGGVANAHKTAVLEEGMKWEKMTMTAEDAQFLETRKYQRSEICGFFRVPAHFVNDLEAATFSNIEHLSLSFAIYSLTPHTVNIEQALRRDLIPVDRRREFYFKFSLNAILRGDAASRAAFYQSGLINGWLNDNEVRDFEDLNPYEGGDTFRVPANLFPVGEGAMDAAELQHILNANKLEQLIPLLLSHIKNQGGAQ